MTTNNKSTSQDLPPDEVETASDNAPKGKAPKAETRRRRIVKIVIAIVALQTFLAILLIACILVPMLQHSRRREVPPSVVVLPFDTESVVKQVIELPWSWLLESSADGVESRLELQLEELEKAYPSTQAILVRINGRFLQAANGKNLATPVSVLLRLSLVLNGNYVCVEQPALESITPLTSDGMETSDCAPLSIHFNQIAAGLDDHIHGCKIGVPLGTADIRGIDNEHLFLIVNQL